MAPNKVSMGLADRDLENTSVIYAATHARTKAQAVSIALSLTRYLVEQVRKGARIHLVKDGETERVVMTELEELNQGENFDKRYAFATKGSR